MQQVFLLFGNQSIRFDVVSSGVDILEDEIAIFYKQASNELKKASSKLDDHDDWLGGGVNKSLETLIHVVEAREDYFSANSKSVNHTRPRLSPRKGEPYMSEMVTKESANKGRTRLGSNLKR